MIGTHEYHAYDTINPTRIMIGGGEYILLTLFIMHMSTND